MSWIGVDLDGTLATYNSGDYHRYGPTYIGEPIPEMVQRVKNWLADGREVRIMTARVVDPYTYKHLSDDAKTFHNEITDAIAIWCNKHIGQELDITCVKDYQMIELWDDRAVAIESNTGKVLGGGRLNRHYEFENTSLGPAARVFLAALELGDPSPVLVDEWCEDRQEECTYSVINMNDIFYWGCPGSAIITPDNLPLVRNCLDDTKQDPGLLYACRVNGMRPQGIVLARCPKPLKSLIMKEFPEREINLVNPYDTNGVYRYTS